MDSCSYFNHVETSSYFLAEGDRLGTPGASHGGYGGRGACNGDYLTCRQVRNDPYGSLYTPVEYGSGGHGHFGGFGGGKIEMHVAGTLEVSGFVQANSEDVQDLTSGQYAYSGGGSGGSIYVMTGNFTGE